MTDLLVSYGTLRQRDVQLRTFGREPRGWISHFLCRSRGRRTIIKPIVQIISIPRSVDRERACCRCWSQTWAALPGGGPSATCAVRVRAGARKFPALDDEVLVADLRPREVSLQDLAGARGVARLSRQR